MKHRNNAAKLRGVRANLETKRAETEYAVDVENLAIKYVTMAHTVEAVNNVSFKLKKKCSLGLVGETGAGKTSTMLALLNMVPNPPGVIEEGKILVNGLNILELSPAELQCVRGKEIAMIFQDPMTSLNPVFTVGDQIAESVMIHQECSHAEAIARAKEMLEKVGIDPARSGEYPHQFSGGMRQRVGIAIALACQPTVLIADEPTSALDVTIQAQVLDMMKELKDTMDTALILITHDLGVVAELCDEVAVMYAGRIVEKGTLEELFENTKHPYTEGLFNSLPNVNDRTQKLTPISGAMPDPSNLPKGCAFADRCPYATDACREEIPEYIAFSDTHMVACTAYRDPAFHIRRGAK